MYHNLVSTHQLRVLSKGRQLVSLFLFVVVGPDLKSPHRIIRLPAATVYRDSEYTHPNL